jgi:hypothetical protein
MQTDEQPERQTDGKTESHDETVAFRKFADAPKNVNEYYYIWRVISCNLTDVTDVSEEPATTFFGVEK